MRELASPGTEAGDVGSGVARGNAGRSVVVGRRFGYHACSAQGRNQSAERAVPTLREFRHLETSFARRVRTPGAVKGASHVPGSAQRAAASATSRPRPVPHAREGARPSLRCRGALGPLGPLGHRRVGRALAGSAAPRVGQARLGRCAPRDAQRRAAIDGVRDGEADEWPAPVRVERRAVRAGALARFRQLAQVRGARRRAGAQERSGGRVRGRRRRDRRGQRGRAASHRTTSWTRSSTHAAEAIATS